MLLRFILLSISGGSAAPAAPAVYFTGILNPYVDTTGDFSINEDPDGGTIQDVTTALNPTD
jgi:hypothetical protein